MRTISTNDTAARTTRRSRAGMAVGVAVALAIASSSCAGSRSDSAEKQTTASATATTTSRPTSDLDDVVTIGSGSLHLRCHGAGAVTVLLLAGWDEDGASWNKVEPALAEHTRVCSYSRFGTGSSDKPTSSQTFETQAADLHELLETAGEPGPYVVVGHSFGGAEAVTFASRYADEVDGLALVDASPVKWPATVCSVSQWAPLCDLMRDPANDAERLDVFAAFDQVAEVTSLGDLPMTVVTATHRTDPSLPSGELARLDAAWAEGVERWAALSTDSTVNTVDETGHHIQLDQPAVVIDAVTKLIP